MAAEPSRYLISSNGRIRDRMERLNHLAEENGILSSWVSTMQETFERLETRPESAGDPVKRLRHLYLTVYRLLMNHICIHYAFHDWERILFVQSIEPVLGHPLEGLE